MSLEKPPTLLKVAGVVKAKRLLSAINFIVCIGTVESVGPDACSSTTSLVSGSMSSHEDRSLTTNRNLGPQPEGHSDHSVIASSNPGVQASLVGHTEIQLVIPNGDGLRSKARRRKFVKDLSTDSPCLIFALGTSYVTKTGTFSVLVQRIELPAGEVLDISSDETPPSPSAGGETLEASAKDPSSAALPSLSASPFSLTSSPKSSCLYPCASKSAAESPSTSDTCQNEKNVARSLSKASASGLGLEPDSLGCEQLPKLCKFFLRGQPCPNENSQKGSKQHGCAFRHFFHDSAERARTIPAAVQSAQKQMRAQALEQHPEDPTDPLDKSSKKFRSELFADWLVAKFGLSFLQGNMKTDNFGLHASKEAEDSVMTKDISELKTETHLGFDIGKLRSQRFRQRWVLDVAGGKGRLSLALLKRGISCHLIEPRPLFGLQQPGLVQECPTDSRRGRIIKTKPRVLTPRQLDCVHCKLLQGRPQCTCIFKNRAIAASKESKSSHDLAAPSGPGERLLSDEARTRDLGYGDPLSECSCVVGLHPDQATEILIDVALANHLSFAVVPCCVFPSLFPNRFVSIAVKEEKIISGAPSKKKEESFQQTVPRPVVYYEDFILYLVQKVENHGRQIHIDFLPFKGKNRVLYSQV